MTPSLKKYRVIKVVFLHVSDSKIIKIIKFSSSFVWFVDWTDCFILEGGHWNFRYLRSVFVPKNFGFSDCVFIAVCGFSVHWHLVSRTAQQVSKFSSGGAKEECVKENCFVKIFFLFNLFLFLQKNGGAKAPPAPPSARSLGFPFSWKILEYLMGFGFDLWCGFRIFLFGFWFLFDQSGHYAPPLNSKSRETSVCCTCQLCIGSIKVLRTGMWTFICFDGFACGFRFLIEFLLLLFCCCCFFFFCGFADEFFFLRFLTDPLTDSCFAN